MFKCEWGLWHITARHIVDVKEEAFTFEGNFEELPTPADLAAAIRETADAMQGVTATIESEEVNKGLMRRVRAYQQLADAIEKSEFPINELINLKCAQIDLAPIGWLWIAEGGVWRWKEEKR